MYMYYTHNKDRSFVDMLRRKRPYYVQQIKNLILLDGTAMYHEKLENK